LPPAIFLPAFQAETRARLFFGHAMQTSVPTPSGSSMVGPRWIQSIEGSINTTIPLPYLVASRLCIAAILLLTLSAAAAENKDRNLLVCVGAQATPKMRQAAEELVRDAQQVPLLKALVDTQGAGSAVLQASEELLDKKKFNRAAFNHLIVVGLRSKDPLIDLTWGHNASINEETGTAYMQGFGFLQGDIGYVECDRNPFLYSQKVDDNPFTTWVIRLSGTNEAGVLAAIKSFREGLLNGFVPAGKFKRPQTTILDLDPLMTQAPGAWPKSLKFDKGGPGPWVGWTQVPGNEYRAYIDYGGFEPKALWRVKYLRPGSCQSASLQAWTEGFHRMAYGNAVTVAEFADAAQATKTAASIGGSSGFKKLKLAGHDAWVADQPTDEGMEQSYGKVYVQARGTRVFLSSLPLAATEDVLKAVAP
jgi:hypothetical protein